MKRKEWSFHYSASDLAAAAASKRDAHASKLKWWEEKKADVMKKVTETGIEIQDSVAAIYSNTKRAFGPQIKIDSGLQRDLTECQEKILEHNHSVQEYDGWVQVLTGNASATLDLQHDDYLFFFGK